MGVSHRGGMPSRRLTRLFFCELLIEARDGGEEANGVDGVEEGGRLVEGCIMLVYHCGIFNDLTTI